MELVAIAKKHIHNPRSLFLHRIHCWLKYIQQVVAKRMHNSKACLNYIEVIYIQYVISFRMPEITQESFHNKVNVYQILT